MTKLDDANAIIKNLIKIESPVPANNISQETDEDNITSFSDKLIKANAYLNAWARQGFVLLVQLEVLTLTTTVIVDGVESTDFIYSLAEIVGFPQGVIVWLIEHGADIDPDQDSKFGDGKNFLPEYATAWVEGGYDIGRHWDSNNITPSESIIGGQSITFGDIPNSSYSKDKDEIQNYVPQDTRNKLMNANFQAFIDGNDLPETLQAALFVKKTDLAVTNKNVSNNTKKIAEINTEILGSQTTFATGVSDPLTESLSGSALSLQTARREDVVQMKSNKVLSTQNQVEINNLENQLSVLVFKLNKIGSTLISQLTIGMHYFNWGNWNLVSDIFVIGDVAEPNQDATQLRLKPNIEIDGSLLLNGLNLYLILSDLSGADNGIVTIESYDDLDNIIDTPVELTTIKIDNTVNDDPINFPLEIELTIPANFKYFKLGINVTNGGYNVEIRPLSIVKSIAENASGDLHISLDDYALKEIYNDNESGELENAGFYFSPAGAGEFIWAAFGYTIGDSGNSTHGFYLRKDPGNGAMYQLLAGRPATNAYNSFNLQSMMRREDVATVVTGVNDAVPGTFGVNVLNNDTSLTLTIAMPSNVTKAIFSATFSWQELTAVTTYSISKNGVVYVKSSAGDVGQDASVSISNLNVINGDLIEIKSPITDAQNTILFYTIRYV